MHLKQIPISQWGEIADPVFLASLPILPEEFASKYNVAFEEIEDDGLGIAQVAVIELGSTPYFLIAHPQGHEESHYLTVMARSFEPDSNYTLEKLLTVLGVSRTELRWQNDQLGAAQWVLFRMDDYGNEAEMLRFHSQWSAESVRKRYEDKGHKQIYFVRNLSDLK